MTSNSESQIPAAPAKKTGRINWVVVGVTAAVVAALMFAGGVLATNVLARPGRGGGGGFFNGQRPNFQIQAAKELPTEPATLNGVVTGRNGNTLSVEQRGGFRAGGNNANTNLVDVVIDANTTLYHDTTQLNFNSQQPPSGTIQQTVEPGSADAISTNSRVTVWGTQSGNQLTATVLVYTDPQSFQPPQ
jgi:hypothetical protein